MKNKQFIELLKKEMIPAMGCTELATSALAGAKAKKTLGNDEVVSIRVSASRDIVKNAMSVGIPHCKKKGILVAVALGVAKGDTSESLNILSELRKEEIEIAESMELTLSVLDDVPPLFIRVDIEGKRGKSAVIISGKHDRYSYVERNSQILLNLPLTSGDEKEEEINEKTNFNQFWLSEIVDFSTSVNIDEVEFVKHAIETNLQVAEYSIVNDYGLQVGKTQLKEMSEQKISSLDEAFRIGASYAAAASDARMSGCLMPVVINSGSGNQGLTVTLPVYWLGRYLNESCEKITRAVCISELVGLALAQRKGRLSALCGAFTASIGSACAYIYLLGGTLEEMDMVVRTMIGNLTGIICDGAKNTCALKIYSCLEAAALSVKLALNNHAPGKQSGIVGSDSSESVDNLARISSLGMNETDNTILSIMLDKC